MTRSRRAVRWLAVFALAGSLVLAASATSLAGSGGSSGAGGHPRRVSAGSLRPHIVQHPIPFGAKRRHQTARYSQRHYGQHTWRLHPQMVVEHYTDTLSLSSVFNEFASDAPHMGERPGVCAHFVIARDGTIYQLVPTTIRCRHTIGLNYVAIGIEHVATSDQMVLHDKKQIRASQKLTLWLMAKYGIQARNVIGHNESLRSPFHMERVKSWRCLTHADWNHHDMNIYRRMLRARARKAGVPIGPKPHWVNPHC